MTLCKFLAWDSDFFGLRLARVVDAQLTDEHVRSIDTWAHQHAIDGLYYLANVDDIASIHVAEHHQFRLVDIRLTLELNNPPFTDTGSHARVAIESDLPALRQIAHQIHTDSRFYADLHFDRTRCGQLYEAWIDKAWRDETSTIFTLEHAGIASAYITCDIHDTHGEIGLFGVSPHAQGHGYGGQLLVTALNHFSTNHVKTVSVVTQGKNIAAQNIYIKYGFRPNHIQLWFHKWYL